MTACGSTQAAAGPATSATTTSVTTEPTPSLGPVKPGPSEAATPLPSWAKAAGIASVSATTVLSPEQTCDAVKDILSTQPAGVADNAGHIKWMSDQFSLVRDHSGPETKADMAAIVEYSNATLALLPGKPDMALMKQYGPHWDAVFRHCPNWKKS